MASVIPQQDQAVPTEHGQQGDGRDQAGQRPATRRREVNVSETERWLSLVGGGALALFGLSQGRLGGLALALGGGMLINRGLTGHCMVYQSLDISTADQHGPRTSVAAGKGVKVERTMTINAPADRLYGFWKDLENLPQFMHHIQSIRTAGNRSHWVANSPIGSSLEWNAEIINDRENKLIAWRSLEGADVANAGSVHFLPAPGGRGTEVKVILKYDPPGGKVTANIARLFGQAPEQLILEDLRRFKQFMETGELATTRGQSTCRNR